MTPIHKQKHYLILMVGIICSTMLFSNCKKETLIDPINTAVTQNNLELDYAINPIDMPLPKPGTQSTVTVPGPQSLGHVSDYTTAIEGYTKEVNPADYEIEEGDKHELTEDK